MYEADDAIARVDSYIVSVTGGGKHVGERRLVRIDAVARSQASASLVDNGSDEASDGESEAPAGGDDESPPRRRRGNRGGRGRSGARDESAPAA